METSTLLESSCGYLLQELQMIWDEVGEENFEREKVLLELEQECIEVHRRKVNNANVSRARFYQQLAESEAEFTRLLLSLGERSVSGRPEKMMGTLKEQLNSIAPALKEMQFKKEERVKQFRSVQGQIHKITAEIAGRTEYNDSIVSVNENDLSLKKLEEYQNELQKLHNDKSERLRRVEDYISTIRNLASSLGMDSSQIIITKVHPSLNELSGLSKNISDEILSKLDIKVKSLEFEKQIRVDKLQGLVKALGNLWNLMDTPLEDRQQFIEVTCLSKMSLAEISTPESLTLDIVHQAETEVKRLDQLKAMKMKEFFIEKQIELDEICRRSHMQVPANSDMEKVLNQIISGEIDHVDLLKNMEEQISKAEEEATSRKVIMERVEKWILACNEEQWLEDYNRDQNRYSARRGAHKNLKRAERARVMVSKIPALVDLLICKTKSWEDERNKMFLYDEVPLLAMLEDYNMMMKEKEEGKLRQREMKKTQVKAVNMPASHFGSRPTTSSSRFSDISINRGFNNQTPPNRRHSLQMSSNNIKSPTLSLSLSKGGRKVPNRRICSQKGFPSHLREETISVVSSFSGPFSP